MNPFRESFSEITLRIDQKLGTHFKSFLGNLYSGLLRKWSPFRRIIDPFIIRIQWKLNFKKPKKLQLHLGCGAKHVDGYINVDLWLSEATDVISDITKLPWPDNSTAIIECYHVLEHISHLNIRNTLKEWYRVSEPGGRLIIEAPYFDEAVKEYLAGNEERLINVFGRQRFPGDAHLYGYNPERLIKHLQEAGFSYFTQSPPQSSQSLDEPSFRVECRK